MIYALIKDGIVKNVIVAEAAFIDVISNDWDYIVDITDTEYGVGWTYNGEEFAAVIEPAVEVIAPISTEGLTPISTNTK